MFAERRQETERSMGVGDGKREIFKIMTAAKRVSITIVCLHAPTHTNPLTEGHRAVLKMRGSLLCCSGEDIFESVTYNERERQTTRERNRAKAEAARERGRDDPLLLQGKGGGRKGEGSDVMVHVYVCVCVCVQ